MLRSSRGWVGIVSGFVLGTLCSWYHFSQPRLVQASTSDRFEDYVMVTGAVAITPKAPTDGVWMVDYRAGELLGTVIDRNIGKIQGWAELDLLAEFDLQPRQAVHFLLATGNISQGQAALYVAETSSGKFGVYTLGSDLVNGNAGLTIRRHDMSTFRKAE